MAYETEPWAYIGAKFIGERRSVPVRVIVIHDAEFPEVIYGARGVAKYGQKPIKPSSWHISVDNQEVVQSVKDSFVAWAAPGCNHDGIQVELVGYQSQAKEGWLDNYSLGVLALGADAVAQYCLKYTLPPIQLTDEALLGGAFGIVGHDQVSRVYRQSDHSDPGPNFPWRLFIAMVQEIRDLRV